MSIMDELNEELKKIRPSCAVCAWLSEQDEELQESIENWLLSGRQAVIAWRVCARRGLPVGETTMRKHRRTCLEDNR